MPNLLPIPARLAIALLFTALASRSPAAPPKPPPDRLLYDFETPADADQWSNLQLPDPKRKDPRNEPPVKIEISNQHATAGQHSLKLTFAGGDWPTITTTTVFEDWVPYQTFKADVTAGRDCIIGFAAYQEKSTRDESWEGGISRWVTTAFVHAGRNEISAPLHHPNDYAISAKYGKVVRFEIFMYDPHDGESIYVDNIRLSGVKDPEPAPSKVRFQVAGTDMQVANIRELSAKLKDQWKPPQPKTVEQAEADFAARFDELKKSHPTAILSILRDGQRGYNRNNPDEPYAGWKDAYFSSHGPDGLALTRATNEGRRAGSEVFMRHRSPMMRVDLSTIPTGSQILAAQLLIVRRTKISGKENNANTTPNIWVAEPCRRAWDEYEVNAFRFAKDKYWKAIGGMDWSDDGDFAPIYFLLGPGTEPANAWDFTEAVKYWTDGKHENHGFMPHCDGNDFMPSAHYREAANLKDRPAVMVIYEPKK